MCIAIPTTSSAPPPSSAMQASSSMEVAIKEARASFSDSAKADSDLAALDLRRKEAQGPAATVSLIGKASLDDPGNVFAEGFRRIHTRNRRPPTALTVGAAEDVATPSQFVSWSVCRSVCRSVHRSVRRSPVERSV